MIKKIGEVYVMDEVMKPMLVPLKLKKSERLTLIVGPDCLFRRTCGNCGTYERPDIYSVQAGLKRTGAAWIIERGAAVKSAQAVPENVWICDDCAARLCPELLDEANRLRAEAQNE